MMYNKAPGLYARMDKLNGCPPKLCKDCKFFMPPPPAPADKFEKLKMPVNAGEPLSMGKCSKFGEVNLIDGVIAYPYAASVRPSFCQGTGWEPIILEETASWSTVIKPSGPFCVLPVCETSENTQSIIFYKD